MKLGSIKPKEGKTLLRFVLENGIILLCATGRKDESNKKNWLHTKDILHQFFVFCFIYSKKLKEYRFLEERQCLEGL